MLSPFLHIFIVTKARYIFEYFNNIYFSWELLASLVVIKKEEFIRGVRL